MNPIAKTNQRIRVKYKHRNVFGWANGISVRKVYGVGHNKIPIRREIYVNWDDTFPSGFINIHEIEKIIV